MKSIFERAKEGDISILSDPNVSLVKDNYGRTPLHLLAWKGKIEVLSHKDCSLVKNNYGETPLHRLAWKGKIEVSHLKELFPWYKRKCKGKVIEKEIDEILNTPNSIQYILEDDEEF